MDEIFTIHGMTIAKILRELGGVPYIIFTTSNVGCESNVAEYALGIHYFFHNFSIRF